MSVDLGKIKINDLVRVSSAAIFLSANFGDYTQYETWIFSKDNKQKTRQVIHGTNFGHKLNTFFEAKTKKIHKYISDNLVFLEIIRREDK